MSKCSGKTIRRLMVFLPVLCLGLTAGPVIASSVQVIVDFRQGANKTPTQGNVIWINGILQQSNSTHYEGMSTLQTAVFWDITATSGDVHTLTLQHQACRATIHAYDFITSWSQALTAANMVGGPYMFVNLNECGDDFGAQAASVCTSLHAGGYTRDVDVPDAMGSLLGDDVGLRVANYEAVFGNRTIRLYGNADITAATLTFDGYSGSDDQYADYTLTWTSSSDQIVVEMAGHLAAGIDALSAGIGYGTGRGSSNISGGPYHFKLMELDSVSLGSQDNQIKGADILLPLPTSVKFSSWSNIKILFR